MPVGGLCMVLMVLEVILVVLGVVLVVVLVVLHGAQRQCSEQMFGTDSVRNNVPSQHSFKGAPLGVRSIDRWNCGAPTGRYIRITM